MSTVAIDLSPLINQVVLPLLTPVVVAVATWAVAKIGAYAHFQFSAGQRSVVETAIQNGIAFAESRLAGKTTVQVSDKVAAVYDYVEPKVPGALKALNITPDHLEQLIEARLPKAA